MKNLRASFAILILLAISTTQVCGQVIENPEISDFSWLAGNWVGDGFGGVSQEAWTEPKAGSMIGTYKHFKDDKVTFYEIMLITKIDEAFTLRLKHFNADLTGWEEKDKFVEFPFESATANKIVFKGLSYELIEEGKMEIRLKLNRGGEVSTEVFRFDRCKI